MRHRRPFPEGSRARAAAGRAERRHARDHVRPRPDSAGFAVYGTTEAGHSKITLQSPDPDKDFAGLDDLLAKELGASSPSRASRRTRS